MMTCPKCSRQNAATEKFCGSCGATLASEIDQLLEAHGLSDLHAHLKDNDLLSVDTLKSLTDNDLDELNLPSYGDRIRFKKMLDSLKPAEPTPAIRADEPEVDVLNAVSQVPAGAPAEVNLIEESKKLLRHAALQGINMASELIASPQQDDYPAAVPSAAALSALPPIPSDASAAADGENDKSLTQKINRGYLFMLWGWLTYGILGLVAWYFAYKNAKNSRSEILRQHCRLQIKLSSVFFGVWFLGAFVAGIVDKPSFFQVYGLAWLLTLGWYIVGAWKGRKALKEGRSPL